MSESIDIMWLMPDFIEVRVGVNTYTAYMDNWKYVLIQQLSEPLEADNVYIYVKGSLFDTIDRRIALRAWDTLHLEYSIYVGE